jgi:hypothetical protein
LDESFHIDGSRVQQWPQDRLFGRFRKFLELTFEAGGPAHDQELLRAHAMVQREVESERSPSEV